MKPKRKESRSACFEQPISTLFRVLWRAKTCVPETNLTTATKNSRLPTSDIVLPIRSKKPFVDITIRSREVAGHDEYSRIAFDVEILATKERPKCLFVLPRLSFFVDRCLPNWAGAQVAAGKSPKLNARLAG